MLFVHPNFIVAFLLILTIIPRRQFSWNMKFGIESGIKHLIKFVIGQVLTFQHE